MKKFFALVFIFLGLLLTAASQQPSQQELKKTSENIRNLIRRDSINNLIIGELEAKIDSLEKGKISIPEVTAADSGSTHFIQEPTGPKIPEPQSPLLTFIILSFTAGLLALITPCVFPMIPLTVTFFTSSSSSRAQAIRKAFFYGFSIVLIYTVIGLIISATLGPSFVTFMSVHWLPNLIFFIIFIVFGLSFLGLFEITLPTSFVNRVDQQAEKGGYYGVFFMAFTLVLVSFSCTGPIVGSIIVQAFEGKEKIRPLLGMLSYSLAFAIPFTIFAMFPQLLARLPKSGGWLNVVKVILGFVEFALALKFLSMIDQVYHLKILDREIFIAIWIVISILLGMYLLGKFRLPHDTEIKIVSVPRLVMAIFPLVFAIYLLPGMFGAPLKALSGYLPPMNTHDFDLPGIIREYSLEDGKGAMLCDEPKYKSKFNLPHGLKAYFEYEQALKCAREKKIPLFIDFTGHGCQNCRLVEANVWSDPEVLKLLRNNFVIVALYNDDKTPLPKAERYTSKITNIDIETIGERNLDLEQMMFGVNSQPFYVILDPFTQKPLTDPVGYEPSITNYLEFLNSGIGNFNKKK
jgi:thiol:disulfide interchange protein